MHELGLIIEMGAMQPLSMKYENHRLRCVCVKLARYQMEQQKW